MIAQPTRQLCSIKPERSGIFRIAAIAANESWKPMSKNQHGRIISITHDVNASTVSPCAGRPRIAASPSAATMIAARTAGASPPTSPTYASTATSEHANASPTDGTNGASARIDARWIAHATRLTCIPLTAIR
jgi:hypothetical protein